MKLLVINSGSANLGDTAMLEGVVLNLLRNLPTADLYVAERPGLRTDIWALPRVHRQFLSGVVFPGDQALAELRYLWRYDGKWRRAVHKWLSPGLGRIFSTRAIGVRGLKTGKDKCTLQKLCAGFDALHIAGGGYLTDTFPEILVQVFCLVQAFAEQGKPIVLTGQQVGPFQSQVLQALVGRLLRGAQFVGLREPAHSVELCQEFHLDSTRFRVMGDDSFGLPCSDEAETEACLAAHGLEPGKFLAFNVRVGFYAAGHGQYLQFIARLAEGLAHALGLPILMVPIAFNNSDSDDRTAEQLLNLMRHTEARRITSEHLTPGLVRGLLGKAFGAVGVSYHFCTFGLAQGVPAVCLHEGDYYSQKARGICGFWQDNRLAISLREADISSAVKQVAATLRDSALRAKLAQRARFAFQDWRTVFDEQVQKHFGGLRMPSLVDAQRRERAASAAISGSTLHEASVE